MTRSILLTALLLSACATTSDDVETASVSPSMFSGLSCTEMKERSRSINDDLVEAEDRMDGNAQISNLVMFGILDAIGDPGEEVARLRGQQIAIRQAFRQRGCVA